MTVVHDTARVDKMAQLADDVRVEANVIIEGECQIGPGSVIGANSIIWRGAIVGARCRIFPFCSLGGEPQDKKYRGEPGRLTIGDDCTIREYCFFNKGTAANRGETVVGRGCWIMAYVHIAHDCEIGDDATLANAVQLAGHVQIGAGAILGGGCLVHQFRRIGKLAMIGGGEVVRCDVPPFAWFAKNVLSVNTVGLSRAGRDDDLIAAIKKCYKLLYREDLPLDDACAAMEKIRADSPDAAARDAVSELLAFLGLEKLNLLRPQNK